MQWHVPTLADVLEARLRISPHLRPTPLYSYSTLNDLLGAEVFVKHENHQPVGAFKVRGGVNLISQLSADERERGVIAASTWRRRSASPRTRTRSRLPPCAASAPNSSSTDVTSTRRASTASNSRATTAIATCTPATSRC